MDSSSDASSLPGVSPKMRNTLLRGQLDRLNTGKTLQEPQKHRWKDACKTSLHAIAATQNESRGGPARNKSALDQHIQQTRPLVRSSLALYWPLCQPMRPGIASLLPLFDTIPRSEVTGMSHTCRSHWRIAVHLRRWSTQTCQRWSHSHTGRRATTRSTKDKEKYRRKTQHRLRVTETAVTLVVSTVLASPLQLITVGSQS